MEPTIPANQGTDEMQPTTPDPSHDFPVIGVGASAGGLQALRIFFEQMPPDSGVACVVVVHLSPEHESNLPMLLQQYTCMPVVQVREPVPIEPDHVYVISPTQHLSMEDGKLTLFEPERPYGRRVSIDLFFRALAESRTRNAVAVILSGAGSDGAVGLMRVKEMGGLTLVQNPDEAEYDSMPRSAIATGIVDYVLPVAQIPGQIVTYRHNAERIRLPEPRAGRDTDAVVLREIFALLRVRTGHDFSNYKRSTVLRRLARRLQINGVTDLPSYLVLLRDRPGEIYGLLRDLLISVTNFFRDSEAFNALEAIIPSLFAGKRSGEQLRVWVAGCATGEEAYSVAILLREYAVRLEQAPEVLIFATDIDEEAIATAREGLYLENIVADVSPERLQRFFSEEQGRYRIKKDIRDMVLFALHNLLRDPPFSRLDLVTCRNLLIYLDRDVQERVLELFHFVLRPEGRLMLGVSEAADTNPSLFTVVDKKNRIFARRSVSRAAPALPTIPLAGADIRTSPPLNAGLPARALLFGELHQRLLEEYAPPSLVVNEEYEIVHLSNQAGRYLQFTGGEPSYNLLKVVHPDLRLELRTALFRAAQKGRTSAARRVPVQLDGQTRLITISVRPAQSQDETRGFLLVLFDEIDAAEPEPAQQVEEDAEPLVRQLDEELQRMREQLRMTVEQYETSTEELKAFNEELQAINEELRSTTEELETSKEELQSLNEELITVNQELKNKVDEISRVNSDLQNLMASTDIGTIFLDRDLRIKRFTPRAQDLFNVIPADVNRPLAHVTNRLNYPGLLDDAARVLSQLNTVEHEVQNAEGRWFLGRLLPYRTLEDRIDGVVLTFIDITERKRAELALSESRAQLAQILEQMPVGVVVGELNGRLIFSNKQFKHIFSHEPLVPHRVEEHGAWQSYISAGQIYDPAGVPLARALRGESTHAEEMRFPRAGGGWITVLVNATPIRNAEGRVALAIVTAEDISERKQFEQQIERLAHKRTIELQDANRALELAVEAHLQDEEMRTALMRRLGMAQEEERKRISRELHDQMSQQLTALLLQIQNIKDRSYGRDETLRMLEQMRDIVKGLNREVQATTLGLRPSALDDLGLAAALANFADDWAHRSGIRVAFHNGNLGDGRLPAEIETVIYRVAQEALTNVVKHAQAQQVSLIIERRGRHAVVIIEDNGQGFDVEALLATPEASRRLGLLGMQERVAQVNGTLEIESTPGQGTTIFVRIPLPEATEEADGETAGLSG